MATGFPVKANYATGDVLTADNMNDLAGTLNQLDPTAKGDLFPASDASTLTRLAVGSNGLSLVADSSASTGIKWGYPNAHGCYLRQSAAGGTAIANNTNTAILFDTENFDTDAFHSTSTNTSRITIPSGLAGKYLVTWQGNWASNATGRRSINLYGNGVAIRYSPEVNGTSTSFPGNQGSVVLDLAVGDYLELFAVQTSGGSLTLYADAPNGFFSVMYLGV